MSNSDLEKSRENQRRCRAKRLALGMCDRCNNPKRAGRTLCSDCAEEARRRKSDLKAQGMCVSSGCGAAALPEQTMCSDCLVRLRDSAKKLRKRRKAQGMCFDCGNPSRPWRVRCASCAASAGGTSKKSYRKRKDAEIQAQS